MLKYDTSWKEEEEILKMRKE